MLLEAPSAGRDAARSPLVFDPSRFGMLAFMGTVSMLFIGFTSSLMLRRTSPDWLPLQAPGLLWLNTLVLAASSLALETARRRGAHAARGLVSVAGVLGVAFVVGQFFAWRGLAAQGIYMSTNPASSFFYMLTGVHLVHLLGGLLWFLVLLLRQGSRPGAEQALGLFALYWHFLGGLWLYLLIVLFVI